VDILRKAGLLSPPQSQQSLSPHSAGTEPIISVNRDRARTVAAGAMPVKRFYSVEAKPITDANRHEQRFLPDRGDLPLFLESLYELQLIIDEK